MSWIPAFVDEEFRELRAGRTLRFEVECNCGVSKIRPRPFLHRLAARHLRRSVDRAQAARSRAIRLLRRREQHGPRPPDQFLVELLLPMRDGASARPGFLRYSSPTLCALALGTLPYVLLVPFPKRHTRRRSGAIDFGGSASSSAASRALLLLTIDGDATRVR